MRDTSAIEMGEFRSIKIFHDLIHKVDFCYLAELFRFMGILVCEEILVEDRSDITEIERATEYSAYICVGKKEITEEEAELLQGMCSAEEYKHRIGELPANTIYIYDCLPGIGQSGGTEGKRIYPTSIMESLGKGAQKAKLTNLMGHILDSIAWWKGEERIKIAQIQALIDVYVDNDLCRHSMNMQYFPKRKSFAIDDARAAFLASHDTVKAEVDAGMKGNALFLYRYAMLWCEVKTNNACEYSGQILFFIHQKLVDRCKELCMAYPQFSNAKVLLGLCHEPLLSCANQAVMAFQNALQDLRSECFGSAVYYWVGKRFEQYDSTLKYAEQSYEAANKVKVKFRNIFKLAIIARNKGEYSKAIGLFERILKKLEMKTKMNFEDPLELEYSFKARTQISYIYYKMEDETNAILNGKKALKIIEEDIPNNKYFETFYGENADDYKVLVRERCNPDVIYRMFIECYGKISRPDMVRIYQEKIKNEMGNVI